MKFAIGIPTLNRADLLAPSLEMYLKDFPGVKIYIVDNGNQKIRSFNPDVIVLTMKENIGCGPSWNVLLDQIFKNHEYGLILNDDIYLGKNTKDIESIISKKPESFLTATPDWCAFIIPKSIYQNVGQFDECFYPAYYEDNSYAYRMKLKGLSHIKTPYLNPSIYRASQTIDKDKSLFNYRLKNKELYVEMWGGLPERETYKTPYNK
jgi:GT2 family glycosyltransferase